MPRYEMMRGLLDGEYRLGDPWKLPKGAGFVLPLLGEPPFPERDYVLLQEVADRVEFRDSGSIYGVEASNRSGRNVFVRRGTLLTGKGTQSRSPVSGVVLLPGKEFVTIPVNCVHQSHYISTGADFKAEGVAPHSVYQALGKQSATWESIAGYTRKMRSSASRMLGRAEEPELEELRGVADDNLVGASAAVERLQSRVEDALGKIPGDHVDQVGVAVFDLDGVVGVELFDHPDSWRAFSESIIRSYGEVLTPEVGELYDIRLDRAEPVLRAFLQRVEASERATIAETSSSCMRMFPSLSTQASSSSICQYSVRCRGVRDFSARKEGVMEYTLSRENISDSRYIWALWLRKASRSKYLSLKRVTPPSQAFWVNIGGVTSTNSFSCSHSLAPARREALIFMTAVCSRDRIHRCRLSKSSSSLWYSVMGKACAGPTTR